MCTLSGATQIVSRSYVCSDLKMMVEGVMDVSANVNAVHGAATRIVLRIVHPRLLEISSNVVATVVHAHYLPKYKLVSGV